MAFGDEDTMAARWAWARSAGVAAPWRRRRAPSDSSSASRSVVDERLHRLVLAQRGVRRASVGRSGPPCSRPTPSASSSESAEQQRAGAEEGASRPRRSGASTTRQRRPRGTRQPVILEKWKACSERCALEVGGGDRRPRRRSAVLAQRTPREPAGRRSARADASARHVDVLAVSHGGEPAFRQAPAPCSNSDQPLRLERHHQRIRNVVADPHRHADRKDQALRDRAAETDPNVGLAGLPRRYRGRVGLGTR